MFSAPSPHRGHDVPSLKMPYTGHINLLFHHIGFQAFLLGDQALQHIIAPRITICHVNNQFAGVFSKGNAGADATPQYSSGFPMAGRCSQDKPARNGISVFGKTRRYSVPQRTAQQSSTSFCPYGVPSSGLILGSPSALKEKSDQQVSLRSSEVKFVVRLDESANRPIEGKFELDIFFHDFFHFRHIHQRGYGFGQRSSPDYESFSSARLGGPGKSRGSAQAEKPRGAPKDTKCRIHAEQVLESVDFLVLAVEGVLIGSSRLVCFGKRLDRSTPRERQHRSESEILPLGGRCATPS